MKEIKSKKIEVDYESEDWVWQSYAKNLNEIFAGIEKKNNPAVLLKNLLLATYGLLDELAAERPALNKLEIPELYWALSEILSARTIGDRLDTAVKSKAAGEFVEALILHGMPRDPAIAATAKWLGLGKSTVRGHNERYRKNKPQDETRFISRLYLGVNRAEIRGWLADKKSFPTDHPKAAAAFKKTKDLYESESLIESVGKHVGKTKLPTHFEAA